jgi:hypothetical protein
VAKELHYVKYVFGFGIFCCGFPVAECLKGYFTYPVVFKFEGDFVSLFAEISGEVST